MNRSTLDNFAGRHVFLTGHTGFKGSWLALWLHRLGARITGYALQPPTTPNHFDLADVEQVLAEDHRADLRDRDRLREALAEAQPEVVLHLAAQSVVREGYTNPHETYDVNVMGTAALLDALRDLGKPCVVLVVTTDKVYQNLEQVWGYREIDPLGGYDPYSASKAACDLLTASYRQSFFNPAKLDDHGIKLAVARAGNVIGGGDFTPHALVPDFARAIAQGQTLEVRSPKAVRPWQHVLDCLSGYLTLTGRMLDSDAADPAHGCDAWNFGPMPGNELTVRDLVASFIEPWKAGDNRSVGTHRQWIDASDTKAPHEANVLRLSIDKALWELDWRPRWDVHEALRHTAQWYRAWDADQPMAEISRKRIEQYTFAPGASGGSTAEERPSAGPTYANHWIRRDPTPEPQAKAPSSTGAGTRSPGGAGG